MKNLVGFFTLLSGLVFVGCAPQNQNSGTVNATASGSGTCPAGTWYSNGQCYSGTSVTPASMNLNSGFYASNYYLYGYNAQPTSIQVVNVNKMKELFKMGMGVCDRAANNYGLANCDAYIQGQTDIILQFPQGTAIGNAVATIITRPKQNPYYNYQAQLPNGWGLLGAAIGYFTGVYIPDNSYYQGAYRNPLQIQMVVSPTNNSQGFEARGYGDAWTGLNQTIVAIQVLNGDPNSSNTLNYNLIIGNAVAAQGTMSRCQTPNCGL